MMNIIFRTRKQLLIVSGLRIHEADRKTCYVQGMQQGTDKWINIISFSEEKEAQSLLDSVYSALKESENGRVCMQIQ